MSFINFNTTVESKASDLSIVPIKDGQFLIITDTQKLMYDHGTKRIVLGDIIELATEAERSALITPLSKFYFVKNTGVLWRYNSGTWTSWTDSAALQAHVESVINSEEGVHGFRYSESEKAFQVWTGEWESVSFKGSTSIPCVLAADGWSNGQQTIVVEGMSADQNGVIGIAQDISNAQLNAACAAKMYVCGHGEGTLIVALNGDTPQCDIPVAIILMG